MNFEALGYIVAGLVGFVIGGGLAMFAMPQDRGFWCKERKHYITPEKQCRDCFQEKVNEYNEAKHTHER